MVGMVLIVVTAPRNRGVLPGERPAPIGSIRAGGEIMNKFGDRFRPGSRVQIRHSDTSIKPSVIMPGGLQRVTNGTEAEVVQTLPFGSQGMASTAITIRITDGEFAGEECGAHPDALEPLER
jgi:hypothetical protein